MKRINSPWSLMDVVLRSYADQRVTRKATSALARVALGAFLMVVISAPPAWADAYGLSSDLILDLMFGNATVINRQSSHTGNQAEFQGFGLDTASDAIDARQAKSGPGPFPGENSFNPWGKNGQYARGDSQINGISILDMEGYNIAEAYRTSPGEAFASAEVSFTFGLRQSSVDPISISLKAKPFMQVSTALPGEASHADIDFYVIFNDHSTGALLFDWRPNGNPLSDFTINGGVVTDVRDPFALQQTIDCLDSCSKTYDPGVGDFAISYRRAAGQEYDVTVTWDERVNLTATGPAPIPEPSTLILLTSALPLLGIVRRRRGTGTARQGHTPPGLGRHPRRDLSDRAKSHEPRAESRNHQG